MNNQKICFVAPHAYSLLKKTNYKFAGGAEVQQVLIARFLKKNNFKVSFIAARYSGKRVEDIDGITVFKSSSLFTGGKLRYASTLLALFVALREADADLYFLRSPRHLLGMIAYYCQLRKKKFIFSSSIDYESNLKSIREIESRVSRTLFFYGLEHADAVIVQTNKQKRQFEMNFGLTPVLIKNMCTLPSQIPVKESPPIVLWVGTAREEKRPQLFFKLAKVMPSLRFRMIVAPGRNKKLNKEISEQWKKVPNIDFLGFIPYHEINREYGRASLLVNTANWEGFPNTFLQAWANKTPVVSLEIDPDEVIYKNKLGFHSRTFEQMVKDVQLLVADKNLRKEMGENARKYVEAEHNIEKIAPQYINLFKNL